MLNTPWKLAPLKYKYYGTVVVDSNNDPICDIWLTARNDEEWGPSPREEMDFDDVVDSHYENMRTYDTAMAIVNRVNYLG